MRLSFVSAVVASAALAQVGANPINFDAFRLGRPAALEQRSTVHVAIVTPNNGGGGAFARVRHRCKGMKAAFKQKSIEFSNAFRQALGLATIEVIDNHHEPGRYHILKLGGSPSFVDHGRLPSPGWHNPDDHHAVGYSTFISEAKAKELDPDYQRYPPLHRPGPHVRPACRKSSFFRRIHIALTALGPWEGRVVAFVLGCGIGVLLRMVWVLAVISYRTIKGGSDEPEHEYTEIVFVEEAEEAPEAPAPAYTDEKVEAAPEVKN